MKRGEVYWYQDPTIPLEQKPKKRPVVIVSTNAASDNPHYKYVTVVPVTSKVKQIYDFEVDLKDSLAQPSKAQPQGVFTIPKEYLKEFTTVLDWHFMLDINRKLVTYLEL